MPQISVNTLLSVLNGNISGNSTTTTGFSSVSIDSRTILNPSNTCFFAIVGERNNGHDYIPDLIRKGVQIFVISEQRRKFTEYKQVCFILVPDTLKAIQKLAKWNREQQQHPVLGITGSNGKTIIKEWLYELLHKQLRIVRNPKSYNSQVGVPLSVWLMEDFYELAIFEAGISKPSEMGNLAEIIQATVGIFTNIGSAHQENFNSLEEKINEKLKLFENTKTIVYCSDQIAVHQQLTSKFPGKKLLGWSFNDPSASVYFKLKETKDSTIFKFNFKEKSYHLELRLKDEASIENAAHCAVFLALQGLLTEEVADTFGNIRPIAMRLELKDGINNCKLINDYYNSDINSLAIALNFQEQQNLLSVQKKTIVLSDIRQSGQKPKELYKEVNQLLVANKIKRLIGIGNEISKHKNCFQQEAMFYQDTDAFLLKFNPVSFKEENILLKGAREFHFERISSALQKKYHQTVLEINLNRLVDNLNVFKSRLRPETKVMVMVKAFSYGSGTTEIAKTLQFQQVDYLAVAVADEGIELRKAGIEVPIVVMNPEEHSFESMIEFRLEPNIYSLELFQRFEAVLRQNAASKYPVHIKIESGMNRLGFSSEKELEELSALILKNKSVVVASVFSHLAGSDEAVHDEFTRQQANRFNHLSSFITAKLEYNVSRHLLNSAGIERFPEFQFEMVRLGIGLYGVSSNENNTIKSIGRLKTNVSQIQKIKAGETIGYGRKGTVNGDSEIAILPIGYADGYRRSLSNGVGRVFVKGNFAPVIGNVCMDMCMVDVSGLNAWVGDEVEILGDHVKLAELAEKMDTIPYEVLTGISQRVKRIYIQE